MKFALMSLNLRRALLTAGFVLAASCALHAQPDGGPPEGGPPDGPPPGESQQQQRGPSVERELQHLTQLLTLTDVQQAKVKAVLAEQKQQMDALRASAANAEAGEAAHPSRQQMESVREEANTKIAALLTEAQKAKFDAWQEKRKQEMERRNSEEGDRPPPPPDGGEGGPPSGGGSPGGPPGF